jgi:hypothetical protein
MRLKYLIPCDGREKGGGRNLYNKKKHFFSSASLLLLGFGGRMRAGVYIMKGSVERENGREKGDEQQQRQQAAMIITEEGG